MDEKERQKILIVEDDSYTLNLYLVKLNMAGYSVDSATNGDEALEKFDSYKPDLIILDLLLPGTDGFEVLKKVREDFKSEVPIIILSNLGQQENIDRAMKLGANDYFVKVNTKFTKLLDKIKLYI